MPEAQAQIDDAIQAFADARDAPPTEAMRWALDNWDQAAPRFLKMLEVYTDGSDEDIPVDAIYFIIHLFGDKGEKRAYRMLCRLMLDEESLIAALGDEASVETLKGVLIKCFDGDPAPLREVIEFAEAEPITRGEAMLALAWLARDGQTPEPEFRDYIGRLYRELRPREENFVWYSLVVVAAILGYQEYAGESLKLIKEGLVPREWLEVEDFPELLKTGDATGKQGLIAEGVAPFDDAIGYLAEWSMSDDLDESDFDLSGAGDDEDELATEPHVNPLRHIGRNDPCPCGSGKKYKKCHLVVE
jgi:hypothetical protein